MFVWEATTTSSPKSTSTIDRKGASFAGWSGTVEVRPQRGGHEFLLGRRDAGKQRERHGLACDGFRDRKRAPAVAEPRVGPGEVRWLGVVAAGPDPAVGEVTAKRALV